MVRRSVWPVFVAILCGCSTPSGQKPDLADTETLLVGYPVAQGQTIVLFQSEAAAKDYRYDQCWNVGSDKSMLARLRARRMTKTTIVATNLGDPFANLPDLGFHFERLNGRVVQKWCDDRNIYWAKKLKSR